MNYRLDTDRTRGIKFCDYIEVTDINDDVYVYNVFYTNEYGFCLSIDDEPLIKFLHLSDSKIESYYVNGEINKGSNPIKKIKTDDHWMQTKQKGFSIDGTLLLYDEKMGIKYGLNGEEHYSKYPSNYENNIKVRRKIKGNN